MIGEVRLAEVLVAPSADAVNDVFRLTDGSPAAGRWAADRAMKVSTHFAVKDYISDEEVCKRPNCQTHR